MRLLCFSSDQGPQFGVRLGDQVVPVEGRSARDLLSGGVAGLQALQQQAEAAPASTHRPLANLVLLPPVPDPGKIICIGLNYALHAKEGGNPIPDYPAVFMRGRTSMAAHGQALLVPQASDKLDFEAELAIIIGKTAHRVDEAQALEHVAGYACINEGSVRDFQRKSTQWTVGKNFDQTGGFGPELVSADELPAGAQGLRITSRLNGQTMQDSDTGDMIFSVAKIIALLSEVMTLEPGDVIASGTPSGVGYARKPPVFMQPGDICEIEIEGIGILSNPVEAA